MARRTLHPLLQRVAALALLGVILGIALANLIYPVTEALSARRAALDRLARYEGVLEKFESRDASYNPAELAAVHVDDAEAQIALQSIIDRLARGAGLNVQSIQPMAAEHLGDIGRGVWVEMNVTCDLKALVDFLSSFDAESPLLLVRSLEVERGPAQRGDLMMRVKLNVGRAWRVGTVQS